MTEVDRYSRHLLVRDFGGEGQNALRKAHIGLIGLGGLGAPLASYLVGAGVGKITFWEDDIVEESNLPRQIIYKTEDIGKPKADVAKIHFDKQNPFVITQSYGRFTANAQEAVEAVDILIDTSDQMDVRRLSNEMAVSSKTPLFFSALSQWEGQLAIFNPHEKGACFACHFSGVDHDQLPSCSEAGVINTVAGVMGVKTALYVMRYITKVHIPELSKLMIWDGAYDETRYININPKKTCVICGYIDR